MDDKSDNSLASINYSLRPNKTIARKIIFGALGQIAERLSLGSARYIGMGSIWFMDFVMAHRLLGITKMISIEANDMAHARARYNAPFGCITVKHGYTTDVLPTLNLSKNVNVVWLDHDTTIIGPAKKDIGILVDECKAGSVLVVTVNASAKDLRRRIDKAKPTDVLASQVQAYLDTQLGNDAPREL